LLRYYVGKFNFIRQGLAKGASSPADTQRKRSKAARYVGVHLAEAVGFAEEIGHHSRRAFSILSDAHAATQY
jgi:hypothetical protein